MKFEKLLEVGWSMDIESFYDCFTVVFKKLLPKDVKFDKKVHSKVFYIYDQVNQKKELVKWLEESPKVFIGYNVLGYDAQIIEFIMRNRIRSANSIYKFSDKAIINRTEKWPPYAPWDLSFTWLDLMKVNHYGFMESNPTSLKWLEFTMRWKKMADLPVSHEKPISVSNFKKLLTYNHNDVEVTEQFFWFCEEMVRLRCELSEKFDEPKFMNMSNSAMGDWIMKYYYCKGKTSRMKGLKDGTDRTKVNLKDCIFDYIKFKSNTFNEVLDDFNKIKLRADKKTNKIQLKGLFNKEYHFAGLTFTFGLGGLHACGKGKVWEAGWFDKDGKKVADPGNPPKNKKGLTEYIIKTSDAKSYYPNIVIQNKFFPKHLGKAFYKAYAKLYKLRSKFDKGTAMNYGIKIALNGTYGKFHTAFNQWLKDTKCALKTTVNGQLMLCMAAEDLSQIGELIMFNTDGFEVRIKKEDEAKYFEICKKWEETTKQVLEHDEYSKMVIRDVNNYMAIDTKGEVKRKGAFELYYDITNEGDKPHSLHKNPSQSIVPLAVERYFVDGTPVKDTIENHDNIYDFTMGMKGNKRFNYLSYVCVDNRVVEIKKNNERAIRFYASYNGNSLRRQDCTNNTSSGIKADYKMKVCLNIARKGAMYTVNKKTKEVTDVHYPDLNYEYYINEANSIIEAVEQAV